MFNYPESSLARDDTLQQSELYRPPVTSDDYLDILPAYEQMACNVHPFGNKTVDGYHSELMLSKCKT